MSKKEVEGLDGSCREDKGIEFLFVCNGSFEYVYKLRLVEKERWKRLEEDRLRFWGWEWFWLV